MKGFAIWRETLPRAVPYLRPYRKLGGGSLALTVLSSVLALAQPWPLAILVDGVFGNAKGAVGSVEGGHRGFVTFFLGDRPSVYAVLAYAVVLSFVLTLLVHGTTVIAHWVGAKLEQRMILDLRSDLFKHAQRLSLTFHDARMTGQLMNQINVQASALGTVALAFPPIMQAFLTLIGMFVVTALIDWQVAAVSLIAVPVIWWALSLYGDRIVPRLQRVQSLEWQSLSIVHEAMAMLRVIVSFGRERYEFKRFRSQGEVAVDERVKLTVAQTVFSLAVTTATALGTAIVMGFGTYHAIQGKISVGELLVLISYVAAIYQPLEEISNTAGDLNEHFVQLRSSFDLLETQPEVKEAPDAVDIGRAAGAVRFEDVTFAYQGREPVLKGLTFTAEPGQRVAVVGPTGAGKTTLISLLIRFYDPRSGRVLIDDVDVRKLKLQSLRDQITVVLQEPLLFTGSIADNIRYGKLDATREEVVAAARAANVHDFIESLPNGYETVLGERGAQLSGGERQRISVARAFIKDAPILVLDEPTSSIDSKTEGVILDALEDLMEGRTSFMIAHRLSTVRDADLILVVQDGRIVEQGTHDELIAHTGIYHQLHQAQTQQRRRRRARTAVPDVADGAGNGHAPAVNGQNGAQAQADKAGDFDARAKNGGERERAIAAGDFDALVPGAHPAEAGEEQARPAAAASEPERAAEHLQHTADELRAALQGARAELDKRGRRAEALAARVREEREYRKRLEGQLAAMAGDPAEGSGDHDRASKPPEADAHAALTALRRSAGRALRKRLR